MTAALRVSVIMPFHNAAADLERTLPQLTALAGPIEIILVDDASTDHSAEVADRYCDVDPRASVIHRSVIGGPTRARMTGVAEALGEYVWFCDADDDWAPDIITILFREACLHRADLVACRAQRIEADGREWTMEGVRRARTVTAEKISRLVWTGRLRGYLWNKLIRRDCLAPLQREPLTSQDDFLMLLDVLEHAQTVRLLPDVKYRYRERTGSISTGESLDLTNLSRCVDAAAHRLLPEHPNRRQRRDAEMFTLWFHLVPAVATPVHRGWSDDAIDRVRHEFVPQISWRSVLSLAPWQPSVAAHAALIRLGGRWYPQLYHLARALRSPLRSGEHQPTKETS